MIGTIVFVIVFVAIGLSVVLAAMRSGRKPSAAGSEPRAVRRAWLAGIAVVTLVLGVGVPALVLVNNGDNHAKHGPGGVDLTAAQATGRSLFVKNCSTCHTLDGAKATGRVGPNLDTLNGGNLTSAFVMDAIVNGRARGAGQMPANLLQGQDAKDVASFVSAVAGR
ncbi:c-type cytochrome [Baekduia soli]|uniref:C-type cytochrome n=1 Tax=Baekduia soli TaxID=496014 RepID=A0A5B8U522_9ACTN|nr:c-type cytochrome [Baekduia soli]QEC48041.1 c-type cytochrome [Baekduia soli]